MKKALISDWFDKFGGAEKVVQAICEVQEFDQYFAYIDLMPAEVKEKVFGKNVPVKTGSILKRMGSRFRMLMPIFPMVVQELNSRSENEKCDLIISSSWALSKGFKIPGAKHICYLQARNFKYVWDEAHLYFTGPLKTLSFIKPYLRKFDIKSAQNPDLLISNSNFVREWTRQHYNRDSVVIYPPVEVEDFYISSTKEEEYYITIGRLEPYKRFDIIIDAFSRNGKKLLVLGSGSQSEKLKKKATSNIEFLGFKTKDEVKNLLSKAQAFVYAGVEDFGIVYAEALASGVPVIAYNGGAVPEIVSNMEDGILFNAQNPDAVNQAIASFETNKSNFIAETIKAKANRFSKKRFQAEFTELVNGFMVASSKDKRTKASEIR